MYMYGSVQTPPPRNVVQRGRDGVDFLLEGEGHVEDLAPGAVVDGGVGDHELQGTGEGGHAADPSILDHGLDGLEVGGLPDDEGVAGGDGVGDGLGKEVGEAVRGHVGQKGQDLTGEAPPFHV